MHALEEHEHLVQVGGEGWRPRAPRRRSCNAKACGLWGEGRCLRSDGKRSFLANNCQERLCLTSADCANSIGSRDGSDACLLQCTTTTTLGVLSVAVWGRAHRSARRAAARGGRAGGRAPLAGGTRTPLRAGGRTRAHEYRSAVLQSNHLDERGAAQRTPLVVSGGLCRDLFSRVGGSAQLVRVGTTGRRRRRERVGACSSVSSGRTVRYSTHRVLNYCREVSVLYCMGSILLNSNVFSCLLHTSTYVIYRFCTLTSRWIERVQSTVHECGVHQSGCIRISLRNNKPGVGRWAIEMSNLKEAIWVLSKFRSLVTLSKYQYSITVMLVCIHFSTVVVIKTWTLRLNPIYWIMQWTLNSWYVIYN